MKRTIITAVIMLSVLVLFADSPVVSNVTASQRTDGSKIVDITYDVSDADNDSLWISVKLSNDGGATFTIEPNEANLSGDFGSGIMPGTGKSITWNAGAETSDFDGDQFQIKIIASDTNPVPEGFVLVTGGTFQMGDRFSEGDSDELPLHNVTVSSFYMAETEVTQAEYSAIMGSNPAHDYGVGDNYPVYYVNWYNAVKYCNKKSINEGLTPCYIVNGDTNPDNWGSSFTPDVNWNANGYRLPTEAEWEYAARGGIEGDNDNYRYSGCHNESDLPNYAWYNSNSGSTSHEVATKLPNQLGLYDMSGNEWEWCWDWYGSYSSSSQANPHGPSSGSARVKRGGSWVSTADRCRVASRGDGNPGNSYNVIGFRIVRPVE